MNWYKISQHSVEEYQPKPIPAITDRGGAIKETVEERQPLPDTPRLSTSEISALKTLIAKIIKGSRDWSDEELQLQQNHPDVVEKMLMENYELV